MEKAKLCAYILLAVLCVVIPFSLLIAAHRLPIISSEISFCDYVAVTTPSGEETIFSKEETMFSSVVVAFQSAAAVAGLPAGYEESLFLTIEWICANRAMEFRLFLSPQTMEGYLIDGRGFVFQLQESGVLFFLTQSFSSSLLVGQEPPVLTLGDRVIPYSLCQWIYTLSTSGGAPITVSSGEYQNTEGGSYPVTPTDFLPTFEKAPETITYKIYSGADMVLSTHTLPYLKALPAGDYQLVLVAEWERGNALIRAGYSFLFQIAT